MSFQVKEVRFCHIEYKLFLLKQLSNSIFGDFMTFLQSPILQYNNFLHPMAALKMVGLKDYPTDEFNKNGT